MTEMTTGHLRKPQQHSLGAQSLHYDVVVVKIEPHFHCSAPRQLQTCMAFLLN